jgi:hypothetical protein
LKHSPFVTQAFHMLASSHPATASGVLSVCCQHDACKIWFEILGSDGL